MAITNYEEMSITSPAFNTVREAFDVALQRLLKKMEKSKMDEGQIALNITVTNEDVFTDGDAELGDTDGPEKKPVLKYKITTTVCSPLQIETAKASIERPTPSKQISPIPK